MKELKIGLLGFGTVGTGVIKCLRDNADLIEARTGLRPVIKKVVDRAVDRPRKIDIDSTLVTTDIDSVVSDPEIEVIIELFGGTDSAKDAVLQALRHGKSVVTANKALLAEHGAEIFSEAESNDADIYYEAAVAGGIPIIKALREGLAANHIKSIFGILNGTCNYILTRMERESVAFQQILKDAQEQGYAEAEPSLDIDGIDAAHKSVILASLAYGTWFEMDDIHVEGIRKIELTDLYNAAELGYRIKHLGVIRLEGQRVQLRVHPTLIPADSLLSKVEGVFNAVQVDGDIAGKTLYYGQGAGMDATASAVVADVLDVCLNLAHGARRRISAFRAHESYSDIAPIEELLSRYYIRLRVQDVPGCFAQITDVLASEGISISSVVQKEVHEESVPVVIITHESKEGAIRQALAKISTLAIVNTEPVMIRIEDI